MSTGYLNRIWYPTAARLVCTPAARLVVSWCLTIGYTWVTGPSFLAFPIASNRCIIKQLRCFACTNGNFVYTWWSSYYLSGWYGSWYILLLQAHAFVTHVSLCYPCIPLLRAHPFVTRISLCYPCNPLLQAHPFVTSTFLCYWCIPLLPMHSFVTSTFLCYWCIPLLWAHPFVTDISLCYRHTALLQAHFFVTDAFFYYAFFWYTVKNPLLH